MDIFKFHPVHARLDDYRGRDPSEVIDELWSQPGPDGTPGYLVPEVLAVTRSEFEITRALHERLGPETSLTRIGEIFTTLSYLGQLSSPQQRQRFFRRAGRAHRAPRPPLMQEIPSGVSSHGAHISGFLVAIEPVSQQDFARLEPGRAAFEPTSPVQGLSWFEANLYAAFVECHLPAESRMEYLDEFYPQGIHGLHQPQWCVDGPRVRRPGALLPLGELRGNRVIHGFVDRHAAWPTARSLNGVPTVLRLISHDDTNHGGQRHQAAISIA